MPLKLSFRAWNKLIRESRIEDISSELPDGFLMFGQLMRAKIRLDGKVYYATAWTTGEVRLQPCP